jgi:hypothetical protein
MPKSFWPHQEQAMAYALERDRIALFMEMRCGKTPVAVRWAKTKVQPGGTILVLGPVEVLDDWIDEIRYEGETRILDATGMDAVSREATIASVRAYRGRERLWVLFNYEAIRASQATFLDRVATWDCVICDESTKIRNPKAQTTKVVTKLAARVPYRAILSGLPAPEGPEDYFSQFVFLNGMFNGYDNFWLWRNKKFKQPSAERSAWLWMPLPETRTEIKTEVHRHAFRMTRKQANIGGDLVFNRWTVLPTEEQVRAIKSVMKGFAIGEAETQWATVRDVWLARLAGGYLPEVGPANLATGAPSWTYRQISDRKHVALLHRLQTDLRGEPVVVWFRFNRELFDVHTVLQDAGIHAEVIAGLTPRHRRIEIRREFRAGKVNVLLVQLKTGLYGLNLSRASTAIFFSNMYDLEVRAQALDRIIHGSKRTASHAIDLVTKGTIDEAVVKALKEKRTNQRAFDAALASEWAKRFQVLYGRPSK